MAIRFEKLTVKNRDTGEVIVSKSIDGPTGLKFCVEAPANGTPLNWEIWVKKMEEPYEDYPFTFVWEMTSPPVGIIRSIGRSEFHHSPYCAFISFGPKRYEIYGYKSYKGYEGFIEYKLSLVKFETEEVEDAYIITMDPEMFISEHEGEKVYFPKYYCQILWMRERFPRIAGIINRIKG